MKARKWGALVVTIASAAVAGLLVFALYSIVAMAGIAAEIILWPFYTLLGIGIFLSVAGLFLTKRMAKRASRYVGFVINGCALAFELLIVLGLASMFLATTKERFLIPEGYRGDVYVMYDVPNGESPEVAWRKITYRIPNNGVLRLRTKPLTGWTLSEYDYVKKERLERIPNFWASTIDDTPENRANDTDIGVFFPRTGSFANSSGCSVNFLQFYIGTKAHLLTKYTPLDLSQYLESHPGDCTVRKK